MGGGEVLPEEGVVDVPAGVEEELGTDFAIGGRGVGRFGVGAEAGQERVEVVHVGGVVLGVVESHDLGGDAWLEGLWLMSAGVAP